MIRLFLLILLYGMTANATFIFNDENKSELDPEYVLNNLVNAVNERCRATFYTYPVRQTNCLGETNLIYQYRVPPISTESLTIAWHDDQTIEKVVTNEAYIYNALGEVVLTNIFSTNKYIKYEFDYPAITSGYVWVSITNIFKVNNIQAVDYVDITTDTNIYADGHVLFQIHSNLVTDANGWRFYLDPNYSICISNYSARFESSPLMAKILEKTLELSKYYLDPDLTNSLIAGYPWNEWLEKHQYYMTFTGGTNEPTKGKAADELCLPDGGNEPCYRSLYSNQWISYKSDYPYTKFAGLPYITPQKLFSDTNGLFVKAVTNKALFTDNLSSESVYPPYGVEGWSIGKSNVFKETKTIPFTYENSIGYQSINYFISNGFTSAAIIRTNLQETYTQNYERTPVVDIGFYYIESIDSSSNLVRTYRPRLQSYESDLNPPLAYDAINTFNHNYEIQTYSAYTNKEYFPEINFMADIIEANIVESYGSEFQTRYRSYSPYYRDETISSPFFQYQNIGVQFAPTFIFGSWPYGYYVTVDGQIPTQNVRIYDGFKYTNSSISIQGNMNGEIANFEAYLWVSLAQTSVFEFTSTFNTNDLKWEPDYDTSLQYSIYRTRPHDNRYLQLDDLLLSSSSTPDTTMIDRDLLFYDEDIALACWKMLKNLKKTKLRVYAYDPANIVGNKAYIGKNTRQQTDSNPALARTTTNFVNLLTVTNASNWITNQQARSKTVGSDFFALTNITMLNEYFDNTSDFTIPGPISSPCSTTKGTQRSYSATIDQSLSLSFEAIKEVSLIGTMKVYRILIDEAPKHEGFYYPSSAYRDLTNPYQRCFVNYRYSDNFKDIDYLSSASESVLSYGGKTNEEYISISDVILPAQFTAPEYQIDYRGSLPAVNTSLFCCGPHWYGSLIKGRKASNKYIYNFVWEWEFEYD